MGAFDYIRAALIGRPEQLPERLLRAHPELAAVQLRRGGLAVRLGGWVLGQSTVAAITLWRTVFVAPRVALDEALLLHELRHVHHFQSAASFPLQYVWESLRRGYHANRFEVDARAFAAARLARDDKVRGDT